MKHFRFANVILFLSWVPFLTPFAKNNWYLRIFTMSLRGNKKKTCTLRWRPVRKVCVKFYTFCRGQFSRYMIIWLDEFETKDKRVQWNWNKLDIKFHSIWDIKRILWCNLFWRDFRDWMVEYCSTLFNLVQLISVQFISIQFSLF